MAANQHKSLNEQAADWLARLQSEGVAESDRAALERWLAADPKHAVVFARTEFAWEQAAQLNSSTQPVPIPVSQPVSPPARRWGWAIAAALVGLLIGLGGWRLLSSDTLYTTAVGERRVLTLKDGSQVSLNTDSRLEVGFNSGKRTVRLLKGEALFRVAPDSRRPFVVTAEHTEVRVLGTAFNVRLRSQVVEITVSEGAVAVNDDRVSAGSGAVATAGITHRIALTDAAVRKRLAWRDGAIELRGETLEEAVQEFNRYSAHKLVVADATIATLRVGGRFETDESAKFVNALQMNFSIRAVQGDGGSTYLFGAE